MTNGTLDCVDGYSDAAGNMNSSVSPWTSADATSAATNARGEIERLRYILENVFGWANWYRRDTNINFATGIDIDGSGLGRHVTAVGYHAWSGWRTGASLPAQFPAITSVADHWTGFAFPLAGHLSVVIGDDNRNGGIQGGFERYRFHTQALTFHHAAALRFAHSTALMNNGQQGHITVLSMSRTPGNASGDLTNNAGYFEGNDQILLGHVGTVLRVQAVAVGGIGVGQSRVIGLDGSNDPTTPNTQYALSAHAVTFRGALSNHLAAGSGYSIGYTGSLVNNVSTAGPAAGGRDQAGAFGASNWIHFYYIWNPVNVLVSTTSSLTAPPTGPALPTGYTHWAYAGAVFYNATPLLVKTRMRGASMVYDARQNILSAGAATVETSVGFSTVVPPNALQCYGFVYTIGGVTTAGGVLDMTVTLRVVTGVDWLVNRVLIQNGGNALTSLFPGSGFTLPNIGQTLYYINTIASGTSPQASIDISGYTIPNGGG